MPLLHRPQEQRRPFLIAPSSKLNTVFGALSLGASNLRPFDSRGKPQFVSQSVNLVGTLLSAATSNWTTERPCETPQGLFVFISSFPRSPPSFPRHDHPDHHHNQTNHSSDRGANSCHTGQPKDPAKHRRAFSFLSRHSRAPHRHSPDTTILTITTIKQITVQTEAPIHAILDNRKTLRNTAGPFRFYLVIPALPTVIPQTRPS